MAKTATKPTKAPERWRNSIIRYGEEAPDQLLAHPLNFRIHPRPQQLALEGAINDLGWLTPVVVNETTGHVIDGHLRVELAISRGEAVVPVAYVCLTEAQEAEALATFDPIGAMAVTDTAKLDELLRDVSSGEAAVQAMLAELAKNEGITLTNFQLAGSEERERHGEAKEVTCPECGARFEPNA